MNNNILTKMVIACLCCCTMLVAKTHIDDQVDPSIKAKMELEQQRETEAELNQPIKTQPSAQAFLDEKTQALLDEKKSRTKKVGLEKANKEANYIRSKKEAALKSNLEKANKEASYIKGKKEAAYKKQTIKAAKEAAYELEFGTSNLVERVLNQNPSKIDNYEEFLQDLKANPQGDPYISTRDCADTNYDADGNEITDGWDGCADYYTSWCGNYDTDTFDSNAMCCICGGGEEVAVECGEGQSAYTWAAGGGSYQGEISWSLDDGSGAGETGVAGGGTICLADFDWTFF